MSEFKTNVMRILDKAKITYKAHTYDHSDGAIDGAAVAEKDGAKSRTGFQNIGYKGCGQRLLCFCSSCIKRT